MIIFHDQRCLEYAAPEHPERPERIARTAPLLKDRHPDWEWHEPRAATDGELLRAKISILIRHFIRRSTRTGDTLPARRSRQRARPCAANAPSV